MSPHARRIGPTSSNRLIAHARSHPDQPVLLKVRGLAKERLTHPEPYPYQGLVEAVKAPLPANFAVVAGPMDDALDRTGVLVTVSSTARGRGDPSWRADRDPH